VRGSIVFQVSNFFSESGINQIGTSRHDAKIEARAVGHLLSHDYNKQIGIHSYGTADKYRDIWRSCGKFCKEHYGIRDMENLTPDAVKSFLDSRAGLSKSVQQQTCSAIEKLESALNGYADRAGTGNQYDFQAVIEQARSAARELPTVQQSKAFNNPEKVINQIKNPSHHLAARIQLESGLRLRELNKIQPGQLAGYHRDPITNEMTGQIRVTSVGSKGGRLRTVRISEATYQRLEEHIKAYGSLTFSKNSYSHSVSLAAGRVGEKNHGNHSFRWNYAQKRFRTVQEADRNRTYNNAREVVARTMGHGRGDVTEHYLR